MRDNRDILDKLRWLSNDMEYMEVPGEWLPPVTEAADEIEKLRAALHIIAWEGYEDHDFQRIARAALGGEND